MTMATRILLLLAVTVCSTVAQRSVSQRCLCRKVRNSFGRTTAVADIQVYPPTTSFNRLEFIVSLENGLQYCLDPSMKNVQNLLTRLMKRLAVPSLNEAIPDENRNNSAGI